MDPQNIEYDPWYCFSNTTSIDNFISQTNENYQTMFSGFDYQLKFLISRIHHKIAEFGEKPRYTCVIECIKGAYES
jgi:hypothetical protein